MVFLGGAVLAEIMKDKDHFWMVNDLLNFINLLFKRIKMNMKNKEKMFLENVLHKLFIHFFYLLYLYFFNCF